MTKFKVGDEVILKISTFQLENRYTWLKHLRGVTGKVVDVTDNYGTEQASVMFNGEHSKRIFNNPQFFIQKASKLHKAIN